MVHVEHFFNVSHDSVGMELASAKLLEEKGVDYRLIELTDRAVTVEDVVRYVKHGVDRDEICKTIILKDKEGRMHAVFLKGGDRIDFKKLRRVMGKARVAAPDEVEEATGVKAGAVCPLNLDVPLYVDERVFMKERINFGSGNHLYGIEMSPKDIAKVMDYKVVDAAKV
jgi:prolyl-tRNA editing enzyme YbaK/EbsC (Cys-tRNA(Pro) deacylase)